ncbi:MAG TPA: hypothetical protein VIM02_09510 [Rhizomicrobium sp.]
MSGYAEIAIFFVMARDGGPSSWILHHCDALEEFGFPLQCRRSETWVARCRGP